MNDFSDFFDSDEETMVPHQAAGEDAGAVADAVGDVVLDHDVLPGHNDAADTLDKGVHLRLGGDFRLAGDEHCFTVQERLTDHFETGGVQGVAGLDHIGNGVCHAQANGNLNGTVQADDFGDDAAALEVVGDQASGGVDGSVVVGETLKAGKTVLCEAMLATAGRTWAPAVVTFTVKSSLLVVSWFTCGLPSKSSSWAYSDWLGCRTSRAKRGASTTSTRLLPTAISGRDRKLPN